MAMVARQKSELLLGNPRKCALNSIGFGLAWNSQSRTSGCAGSAVCSVSVNRKSPASGHRPASAADCRWDKIRRFRERGPARDAQGRERAVRGVCRVGVITEVGAIIALRLARPCP